MVCMTIALRILYISFPGIKILEKCSVRSSPVIKTKFTVWPQNRKIEMYAKVTHQKYFLFLYAQKRRPFIETTS